MSGGGGAPVAAPPAADAAKEEMRHLISQNVAISVGTRVLYLVSRCFLPPFTLMYVSLDEYGLWACCFVLVGYLGMSAFGVSNVYVRDVAAMVATGRLDQVSRLVSTGLVLVTGAGLALLALLWAALPHVVALFHVAPALHETAFVLFFGTVAVLVLDLSFGGFAYVLQGLHRLLEEKLVWVASFLLETVLIVAFLVFGLGIYGLLWAFAVRYLVATALYIWLCRRALPGLSIRLRHFDRTMARRFYRYGGIVQLSGFLGMFLRSIERVLAGVFVGVGATGLYDIGEKMPMMGSMIASSMNAAFLPASSHLHAANQRPELVKLYLKGSRYMNMLIGYMMGFLGAFAAPIIAVWIGTDDRYAAAAAILAIFTYPYQINVLTGPGSALYRSVNEPAKELIYAGVQLVLVAGAVAVGLATLGRTITMINVTVAGSMVASALFYLVYTNRYLGISQWEYCWKVHLPGLLPYGFGYVVALAAAPWLAAAVSRWQTLAVLMAAGTVYTAIVSLVLYRALCDWGEREYLRLQLRQTLRRLLPRTRHGRVTPVPAA